MRSAATRGTERWAGICAGGYFACAAAYLGNILALAAARQSEAVPALIMSGLPIVCTAMGLIVLRGPKWAPRWAVVVAAGFGAMHLTGLACLLLLPESPEPLTRSLQWQLAAGLFFVWALVLAAALRLARESERKVV
ncbi:MAG TPA: hypothetical protein VGG34_14980 [Opitutaceae bacterium]